MRRALYLFNLARTGAHLRRIAGPIFLVADDTVLRAGRLLVAAVIVGLAMSIITTLLARQWWIFDLTTHFRLHYVAVALLCFLLALALRRWAIAAAIVVLAAPHAATLGNLLPLGLLSPIAAQAAVGPGMPLRVTTINGFWRNWDGAALISYVEQTDPDILVIQEAGPRWRAELLRIGARYPYATPTNWPSANDVILFSRFPPVPGVGRLANGHAFSHQVANLEIADRIVTLVGVHTPSPGRPDTAETRNRYLAELGRFAASIDHPMVVAGDFNSTAWSPHFADMVAASGLLDTAHGRGWHPTWPSWLPMAGIQIDHVLISDDFDLRAITTGPEIGSDHFPLTVDLTLR